MGEQCNVSRAVKTMRSTDIELLVALQRLTVMTYCNEAYHNNGHGYIQVDITALLVMRHSNSKGET